MEKAATGSAPARYAITWDGGIFCRTAEASRVGVCCGGSSRVSRYPRRRFLARRPLCHERVTARSTVQPLGRTLACTDSIIPGVTAPLSLLSLRTARLVSGSHWSLLHGAPAPRPSPSDRLHSNRPAEDCRSTRGLRRLRGSLVRVGRPRLSIDLSRWPKVRGTCPSGRGGNSPVTRCLKAAPAISGSQGHVAIRRRFARELRSRVVSAFTWLILPVVICLSQRLSHASVSTCRHMAKPRTAH